MSAKQTYRLGLLLGVATAAVSLVNAAEYPRVILAEHPAGYYRLDDPPGAATVVDLSPAHANATYSASSSGGAAAQGATLEPGISTNSTVFTGGVNGSFITIPYAPALSPTNSDGVTGAPFSAECWVKPASASPSNTMCVLAVAGQAIGGAYANGSGWDFSQVPGTPATWQLTMRSQQGVINLVDSSPLAPAQWSYLAATWDGTTATFFVDGVAKQSKAVPGYLAVPNFPGTIGAGPNAGGWSFQGAIGEVALYSNALDGFSISNHFAIGQTILGSASSTASPTATGP